MACSHRSCRNFTPALANDMSVIENTPMSLLAMNNANGAKDSARGAYPLKACDNTSSTVPIIDATVSCRKFHLSAANTETPSSGNIMPALATIPAIGTLAGCPTGACGHSATVHGLEKCIFCGRMGVVNCAACDLVCGWCPCPDDDILSSVSADKEEK